jgi:hypothetical protein
MDSVGSVEILDSSTVVQAEQVIMTPHFCVLVGDPGIGRDPIVVPTLHHEGTWCHQVSHLTVIEGVSEIIFKHFVFGVININEGPVVPTNLPNPLIEIS